MLGKAREMKGDEKVKQLRGRKGRLMKRGGGEIR